MTRYDETIAQAFKELSSCCNNKHEHPNKSIRYKYEYVSPHELILIKITDKEHQNDGPWAQNRT